MKLYQRLWGCTTDYRVVQGLWDYTRDCGVVLVIMELYQGLQSFTRDYGVVLGVMELYQGLLGCTKDSGVVAIMVYQ